MEEANGPPIREMRSSVDLGRSRDYMNSRSKSFSKMGPDAKIEEEMARLFLDQIQLEKEVEKLKCELAHRCDFTAEAAWHLFNLRGSQFMSKADFSESLFSYIGNSYYNREQAFLIFKRYD